MVRAPLVFSVPPRASARLANRLGLAVDRHDLLQVGIGSLEGGVVIVRKLLQEPETGALAEQLTKAQSEFRRYWNTLREEIIHDVIWHTQPRRQVRSRPAEIGKIVLPQRLTGMR